MLSFASATGNFFNRIGVIGGYIKNQKSYLATQLTKLTDPSVGIVGQYNNESDLQAEIGSSYIGILSGIEGNAGSILQQLAADTVNRMVFRDNALLNQNLTQGSTLQSLLEVIRQMRVQNASILAMTVTATPTIVSGQPGPYFTGVGNGVIVASVKRPFDGLVLENSFAETVRFLCTADSYVGGATAGNEQFTVTGQGNESDFFAFDWPLGSNCSITINAIDGSVSNGSGNLLTNSSYTSFTVANVPDNWPILVGTAGVNFFQETSNVFGTGSALRITGTTGTLCQIRQQFGSSLGTTAAIQPLTQYAFNLFLCRDGVAAASGKLTIELTDVNGVVINDAFGVPNGFTIDLTALTTNYAAYNVCFRTPLVLPSSVFISYRMPSGNALSNGRSVYLDRGAFGLTSQLGVSLPYVALFSGSINFTVLDLASLVISNSRGAGGSLSSFQVLLCQLYPEVLSNELLFPSSVAPTISDALIG